jgi:hypothetical protein
MSDDRSPQEKDAALGAGLIQNDKWLNWNILRADEWAEGSAADLLDGGAWRRFCERLGALEARVRGAAIPDDVATRADAFRYLAMLLRNALDVAIEDIDPDRPTIRWADRRNKYGWDCPDALYADDPAPRGRGLSPARPTWQRPLPRPPGRGRNSHARQLLRRRMGDRRRRALRARARRPRAIAQLAAARGRRALGVRAPVLLRLGARAPSPLWIDRIDDGPRGERSGVLEPAHFARRLDAVASHVEASLELWLGTALAQRERFLNAFPREPFGGTAMARRSTRPRSSAPTASPTTRRCSSRSRYRAPSTGASTCAASGSSRSTTRTTSRA